MLAKKMCQRRQSKAGVTTAYEMKLAGMKTAEIWGEIENTA
jgi:hypothetical protein